MISKSFIATPPGFTIKEQIDNRGMTQKDFAKRMGLSEKHISRLINGDVQLTQDVAYRLEMVLGIPASFWNNLEALYREDLVRVENENKMENDIETSKKIPYNEISNLGWIKKTKDKTERVINLRNFFEVSSIDLLFSENLFQIACRKLDGYQEEDLKLLTWAQKAKLDARNIEVSPINIAGLENEIENIRSLTVSEDPNFSIILQEKLKKFGIALVYLPHLNGSFLHGATFYDSKKIVIGLTLRGKQSDKFWFSLFHELGHVVNGHINKPGGINELDEKESDDYARDKLIPKEKYNEFLQKGCYDRNSIIDFAEDINISKGIVVGRLQKDGEIGYNKLNDLKTNYVFK